MKKYKKKRACAGKTSKTKKCGKSQAVKEKRGLFKFRRYKKIEGGSKKKARHPKLIVSQKGEEYGFMGLTESPKRGHHSNIELEKNPQKGNSDKAYLRKEIRYAARSNFGEILNDYNLSERDKKKVIAYIKKLEKTSKKK